MPCSDHEQRGNGSTPFRRPSLTNPGASAMPTLSRRTILTLACGLLALPSAVAQTRAPFDDMALAAALRGGGLVILLRHGATFADQTDSDPVDFDNISAQRNLND